MHLTVLTPLAALVALAAVVPLAGWALAERRVRRARELLRLGAAPGRRLWAPLAIASTLVLVGAAAAQPVLTGGGPRTGAGAGQVLVVVDTSESMGAGAARRTRFARATAAAARVPAALPGARVGLASMTDRVLPHVFPTLDRADYRATLARTIGIDRPPPSRHARLASGFDDLAALGTNRFFVGPGARVALVLTDGESRAFDAGAVAHALAGARVRVVLVRFWRPGERIAGDSVYRADAASLRDMRGLGAALGVRTYDESELGAALAAAKAALGSGGKARAERSVGGAKPVAPYLLLAAFLPLGALVARRVL